MYKIGIVIGLNLLLLTGCNEDIIVGNYKECKADGSNEERTLEITGVITKDNSKEERSKSNLFYDGEKDDHLLKYRVFKDGDKYTLKTTKGKHGFDQSLKLENDTLYIGSSFTCKKK